MAEVALVEILNQARDELWDLDDSTTDADLWASPLGRFVAAFQSLSEPQQGMRLLALFAARRAVACWQLYCDDTTPLDGVHTAERVLDGSAPASDLQRFLLPANPSYRGVPIVDCRECDTSCAAAAVAHMARLIMNAAPRDLAICISAADMALDQSPLGRRDQFRRWLIETAIPVALDQRALTAEETSRFRDFSPAEIEVDREAEHPPPSDEAPPRWRPWWQFWK
jgi:hypothetical protein